MFKFIAIASMVLNCSLSMAADKEGKLSSVKRNPASSGKAHPCAADALSKALPLLKFHFGDNKCDQPIENESIDQDVKVVGTTKLLVGKGVVDVLEVTGYIYKATYRMHLLYAKIPGTCALMGQEIFEMSNPY